MISNVITLHENQELETKRRFVCCCFFSGGEGRSINQKVTFTIDSTLLFRPALPGSLESWVLGYKISQIRGELGNEIANF